MIAKDWFLVVLVWFSHTEGCAQTGSEKSAGENTVSVRVRHSPSSCPSRLLQGVGLSHVPTRWLLEPQPLCPPYVFQKEGKVKSQGWWGAAHVSQSPWNLDANALPYSTLTLLFIKISAKYSFLAGQYADPNQKHASVFQKGAKWVCSLCHGRLSKLRPYYNICVEKCLCAFHNTNICEHARMCVCVGEVGVGWWWGEMNATVSSNSRSNSSGWKQKRRRNQNGFSFLPQLSPIRVYPW